MKLQSPPSRPKGVPRRVSRMFMVVPVAFLALLAGCFGRSPPNTSVGKEEDAPALTTPSKAGSAGIAHPPDPNVALSQIGLVDAHHIDSSVSQWSSEELGAAALAQLNRIGKLWVQDGFAGADRLETIVAFQATSSHLRPKSLEKVYDDGAVSVWRPSAEVVAPDDQERSKLVDALHSVAAFTRGCSEKHVAFKISRVDLDRENAHTLAHLHISGISGDQHSEQTALWRCSWTRASGELLLSDVQLLDYEEVVANAPGGPIFKECTSSVLGDCESFQRQLCFGVDHWTARIEQRHLFGPSGWQGMAMGDVNGDGLDDIYVCQGGGLPNRLYVQDGQGRLVDRSADSGADWWEHSHGALLVDLDNDGDQDLAIGLAFGLALMANDGAGKFTLATSIPFPDAIPYSISAADFDNDGDLDLYACCYSLRASAVQHRFLARPIPYHDANNGGRNVLLRNDRYWRFTNATRAVGLGENNRRFSLAAAWEDYDNDGDQDLYVANDFGRNNLYQNSGGKFHDVAAAAGVEDISAGMSVAWSDYNQDGHVDLYVSNMWSSAGGRVAYQRKFLSDANESTRAEFQRHARGNSLFLNQGDGTFRDVSQSARVSLGRWAWGSNFVDINNDGNDDLIVANGYITRTQDPGDL